MTHEEIAARLRAIADPHSLAFHGWMAWYPGDDADNVVRVDLRDVQAELVALADALDPSKKGYVMPLDEPNVTRLDFAAPLLPRSAAETRPSA
jgi:hypothetical protein